MFLCYGGLCDPVSECGKFVVRWLFVSGERESLGKGALSTLSQETPPCQKCPIYLFCDILPGVASTLGPTLIVSFCLFVLGLSMLRLA